MSDAKIRLIPVYPGWQMILADEIAKIVYKFATEEKDPGPFAGIVAIEIMALVQERIDAEAKRLAPNRHCDE